MPRLEYHSEELTCGEWCTNSREMKHWKKKSFTTILLK